jgi:hypothetical protein
MMGSGDVDSQTVEVFVLPVSAAAAKGPSSAAGISAVLSLSGRNEAALGKAREHSAENKRLLKVLATLPSLPKCTPREKSLASCNSENRSCGRSE